jgi:hypothetical protein
MGGHSTEMTCVRAPVCLPAHTRLVEQQRNRAQQPQLHVTPPPGSQLQQQ